MVNNGSLIVVEGACDGIGKSTQFSLLKDHLIDDGLEVVTHHFPSYGTVQGEMVERYLRGEFGDISSLSPYFINTLYAVDRAYTWYNYLKDEYMNGKTILLDRYTTSSLIYQSALMNSELEKKKFANYVCDFEYHRLNIAEPDLVIFLNAPFDLVTEFRNKRKVNDGVVGDIHETNLDFMKKVYNSALFMRDYFNWDAICCNSYSDMRSIDDIHNDVYGLVKKKIFKSNNSL